MPRVRLGRRPRGRDPAETRVDFTWIYAYPEDLNDLEVERWGPRTQVPAGGTLPLRQRIEVGTVAR